MGGERRDRLEEVLGGGIGGEFSSSETGRWELPWTGGEAGEVETGAAWVVVEDSEVSFIAEKAEARLEAAAETVTKEDCWVEVSIKSIMQSAECSLQSETFGTVATNTQTERGLPEIFFFFSSLQTRRGGIGRE